MNNRWLLVTAASAAAFGLGFVSTVNGAERFDLQVRNDFFAGFSGNKAAMDRAMANSEAVLASNPNHAEALVWHGAGLFSMSVNYFRSGDNQKGMDFFARGQKEMDAAVALEPDNIGVRIPRGAALMTAGRTIIERNPEQGEKMLAKALSDYEHAYELQKQHLSSMGAHPLGELLFGIADTQSRLGRQERAAEFFDRITTLLPDTVYAKRAALWNETKPLPLSQTGCVGCHTRTVK